jgi:N-acyl-D-aspartate/D-glutamate deacylase
MTSLPAQILGLRDRGLLREGAWADVVVLDLDAVRDEATPLDPHRYPSGVDHVLVNGVFVVDGGKLTGALAGKVITPADKRARPTAN